ncbi:tellurite methyltransferase [Sporomusaceae bacterium BoRhaA]|uniref:methyltransferase domain-containing protein n=1 Tax=Pelorhabdus rhamnosifermentans TaxID=2772457 RepID=UPI001C064130|nr:methyltransferase domain-containing protein [Pelorhabdus rhamnosifermentans]MBU2703931.1 tellurite methyltransferase [Pelorhabdus rhamnosifermentans]
MAKLQDKMLKDEKWFEKEPFGAFWEKGYRDMSVSTMGGPSFEVIEIAPALPVNAKVLDLGCGEGRNSYFLASAGFDVTAIDRSEAGIRKLSTISSINKISLSGIVSDIGRLEINEDYDLIMSHGCLYYLSNMEWRELLTQAKEHTKPGGFNIYTVFVFNDEYPRTEEFKSARYAHSFAPNELREFYEDWDIFRYDVYVKWDKHPGIPLHYHPIEKLVARKPGGSGKKVVIENVLVKSETMKWDNFESIFMGMKTEELIGLCGKPDNIVSYKTNEMQMGAFDATVNKYFLSLWFYGNTSIYVMNNEVCGKSLNHTKPITLKVAD